MPLIVCKISFITRTFFFLFPAFLQMLDSPLAAQQWLSDPDTGPLLVQVSRIYHAEKHAEM